MNHRGPPVRIDPGPPDPQHLTRRPRRGVVPAVRDDGQPVRTVFQGVEDADAERGLLHGRTSSESFTPVVRGGT